MNKLHLGITAGLLVAVIVLGIRMTGMERQLAAIQSQTVPERTGMAAAPQTVGRVTRLPSTDSSSPDATTSFQSASLRSPRPRLANVPKRRDDGSGTNARSRDAIADTEFASGLDLVEVEPLGWPAGERIEHWKDGPKRRWGHEQAAGEPDTSQAGDLSSAWASKDPDGGEEWLQLDFDRPVDLQQVNIVESHNPGAISKVVAVLPDGRESVVWEGTLDPSAADELVTSEFQTNANHRTQSIKVYLDTTRVPGWNEIDAVQVVGRDGSKQWATASSASSSFADP